MQHSRLIKVEILIMVMLTLASTGLAGVEVLDLRCEYLKNPQGIDVEKPRLSWKLVETAIQGFSSLLNCTQEITSSYSR